MNKEEKRKYIFAQLRSLPNATQYVEVTKYIDELEQQCKKQKEVIDKAIEYINHFSKESEVKIYGIPKCKVFIGDLEQLLEILKEASVRKKE